MLNLLEETGMLGCIPVDTHMDANVKLEVRVISSLADKGRYKRLVGKLIYLSHSCPDIGFAVSVNSQFTSNPTSNHMEAVYRVLRYLKSNPGKGLFFRKSSDRNIEVYSDSYWSGSHTNRRTTSDYCTFVWKPRDLEK